MKDKLYDIGRYTLVIAMVGDILVSWIMPLFYKGYSSTGMSISALGNPQSPVRIPFNIWMLAEGILFLLAVPWLYRRYYPVSHGLTYAVIAFTAVFAVGACIFTCFFSVNESKEIVTTASKIHGFGSAIGFMLFLFVPLLLGILSFKERDSMGMIYILCFVISMIFFVLFIISDKPELPDTITKREGLWQRLNLIFMYLPVILSSMRQIY